MKGRRFYRRSICYKVSAKRGDNVYAETRDWEYVQKNDRIMWKDSEEDCFVGFVEDISDSKNNFKGLKLKVLEGTGYFSNYEGSSLWVEKEKGIPHEGILSVSLIHI